MPAGDQLARDDIGAAVCPGPRQRFPFQHVLPFRRDPLGFLSRLASDYGDVVRFQAGADYFLLSHPDPIHEVLVGSADRFTKGPALQRAKVTLGEGLLTSEGALHRRQRRLAQPAFHPQRIVTYAPDMVEQALRMRQGWSDGQSFDIHQQMMELTLQIVARALFGADIGDQVRQIGQAMDVSVGMFTRALMPWGRLLERLPLPSNRRFLQARKVLLDAIQRMIDQRRGEEPGRQDFLSILLRATDFEGDGRGMSDQQLRDEAITIFLAGHETTANALTFTWYLLAQHPEVEHRLYEELAEVLAGRPPTAEDLPRLRYTRAVVAESMRLYPPVWVIGRRAIRDWAVAGYRVPAGSVVLMSQWVVHRRQQFWPDPLKFDPARWEARTDRPKYAYFPFGGGARGCIGESFAWMEAMLALATLAQQWTLQLVPGQPLRLQPTITLRPRGGIAMTARRRE